MKCALIFAVAVCLFGGLHAGYNDAPYEKWQSGQKSVAEDDALSYSTCNNYYTIANCSCVPRKNCDGFWLQSTKDGYRCLAYNSAGKPGVTARADCIRALLNVESETTTDPEVACPENYRIIGCQLHSYFQHQHPNCRPLRSNGKCQVSGTGCPPGTCTDCRVQARCLRQANFYTLDEKYGQWRK